MPGRELGGCSADVGHLRAAWVVGGTKSEGDGVDKQSAGVEAVQYSTPLLVAMLV